MGLVQPVYHGGIELLAIAFRNRKQAKAPQAVMLKKMRCLRQRGRAAKHQHKAAAGGRKRRCLVGHGKACRIGGNDLRQVVHRKQCHPYRRRVAVGEKDLEVCAQGSGKSVTVQVIERPGVVLPIPRLGPWSL
jgi:hypothetical protein